MKEKGLQFKPGKVIEWWDCGNKNATVFTNQRVLANANGELLVSPDLKMEGSELIPPCFIGKNVILKNAKIGPSVSIGNNTVIEDCVIENSIIQTNAKLSNAHLSNSMIGNFVEFDGNANQLSLSDYSTQKTE
jgi:glucose-1-phosphate thymidylyltransferase